MRFREPFLLPAILFAGGIVADRFVSFLLPELLGTFFGIGILWLVARVYAHRVSFLAGYLLWFVAGSASAVWHHPARPPELDAEPNEELVFSGCISDPPELSIGRERVTVSLEPGTRIRINWVPFRDEVLPGLHYGQLVEFTGKVRKPHNFRNPGNFDYEGYLHRQHIYWTGSVRGAANLRVLPGACGLSVLRRIYAAREWVLSRIRSLYRGDEYTSGLMAALLIGDTSQVQKVWTEDYRRTGTYHALVVSGLHVGILAGALLFLFRLAAIPDLYRRSICLMLAWLYAVMAGWQAPVIRSAGGFTLFVIAGICFRKARVLNVLSAVALVFLIFDPEQLFEGSFQLSFLAVAAIGALAAPWLERSAEPVVRAATQLSDTRRDPRLPPQVAQMRVEMRLFAETLSMCTNVPVQWWNRLISSTVKLLLWVYEAFVISLCVGVAMAIPMALYFHRLSLTGISANLIVVPALNIAIVTGFAAVGTGFHWLAGAASAMLHLAGDVAQWHSRWEVAPRVPDPALWIWAALGGTLAAAAWALRHRRGRLLLLSALCIAGLLAVVAVHPFHPDVQSGKLELTAIDVGQGDSLLLVLPDKTTVLLDGGGIPAFGGTKPSLDIGEDVVSSYLWHRGFRSLDVVACTHAHDDHMGGLLALVRNFHPRELWAGANPDTPAWRQVEKEARSNGAEIRRLRSGDGFDQGGATLDVLAPAADYVPGPAPKNDDSLVILVRFGVHKLLLTGDAEKLTEQQLLAGNLVPSHVDVLKVGHHGSKTSTSPEFLQSLHPSFGLISAGIDNSYGHPHPSVLERLESDHVQVYRTDQAGLVSFLSDGKRLTISTPASQKTSFYPVSY